LSKDYRLRLSHIAAASDHVREALDGIALDAFLTNDVLVAAVERWFMIIGEAAWKLPRLEKGQFGGIPWQDIISLRHRLVHGYNDIDDAWLFRIAQEDVPPLARALRPVGHREPEFPFPIKICGLSTPETMAAALDAGADMVALNFYRKSPRSVSLETAAELATIARGRAIIVALTVDPSDEGIDAIMQKVNPDLIQLHGSETPKRCAALSERIERPVMKALGVADATDLDAIKTHRTHIDRLLLDAKPPKDAAYPGGHGKTFDWPILKGLDPFMPFMLSGGLTPQNVGEAIRTVKALGVTLAGVDVSSGVESAPGVKDVEKIKAFIENARKASLEAIA
jgi:phosphoribosylanthranilate isomerase